MGGPGHVCFFREDDDQIFPLAFLKKCFAAVQLPQRWQQPQSQSREMDSDFLIEHFQPEGHKNVTSVCCGGVKSLMLIADKKIRMDRRGRGGQSFRQSADRSVSYGLFVLFQEAWEATSIKRTKSSTKTSLYADLSKTREQLLESLQKGLCTQPCIPHSRSQTGPLALPCAPSLKWLKKTDSKPILPSKWAKHTHTHKILSGSAETLADPASTSRDNQDTMSGELPSDVTTKDPFQDMTEQSTYYYVDDSPTPGVEEGKTCMYDQSGTIVS